MTCAAPRRIGLFGIAQGPIRPLSAADTQTNLPDINDGWFYAQLYSSPSRLLSLPFDAWRAAADLHQTFLASIRLRLMSRLPFLARERLRFWCQGYVRHGDLDSNGHVNNAIYSNWVDDARFELIHPLLVPGLQTGDFLALVTLRIDFLREVRYGEQPLVGSLLTRLGSSSMEFEQCVYVGDHAVARAQSITVIGNRLTGRAKPLTPAQRDLLRTLMADDAGTELVS